MGNGLLACTLAWLVLATHGAPDSMRVLVMGFIAVVYGSVLISLAARPDDIEIVYKG
jgi:hypothetical protein